jgi:hypothetical protein
MIHDGELIVEAQGSGPRRAAPPAAMLAKA